MHLKFEIICTPESFNINQFLGYKLSLVNLKNTHTPIQMVILDRKPDINLKSSDKLIIGPYRF